MNIVNAIRGREKGLELLCDYDIRLYRLMCWYNDVYHGIVSDTYVNDIGSDPPVFACRFSTSQGQEEFLGLANEDGQIAIQNTRLKGTYNERLHGIQAHANAIFDLAWMPGHSKLVTVAGDHTARLWDVEQAKELSCFHGHTRSVKTVTFRHQDDAVFATGARDGVIMIWDTRAQHSDQPRPDNCITNGHPVGNAFKKRRKLLQPSRSQSITGLIFQDDFTLISCAAGDGFIKVWDLRKNYTVHKREPIAKQQIKYAGNSSRNGFSSLSLCPNRITLYTSCMDHVIYAYNVSSYSHELLATYHGHQNHTYYVKTCLSPDGRYLASGSSDNLAYIWRVNKPGKPLIKLSGHKEEVTCIAWCTSDDLKIVTCSDDSCHRIWRVGYEHKIENEEVEIRGRAEPVTEENVFTCKTETPSTTIRSCNRTPSSSSTADAIPGPSNESGSNYQREDTPPSGTAKRSYSQMSAKARFERKSQLTLSPIGENSETGVKRMCMEHCGARRLLFAELNDESATTSSKSNDLDEPHAVEAPIATNSNTATEIFCSPTVNLPNFVMDGTAPHLLQISPQKQKENIDWLTRIRKQKDEQVDRFSLDRPCSPKSQTTAARRAVRSRSYDLQRTPRAKNSVFSLLDFFKALNNDCGKNASAAEESSSNTPSTDVKPCE